MGLNILLSYSDVASMTLHFFHQILVQHVIQLQFLQVFLENLFIFSDEVKKELPEAHIFFQNPAKMVLSWLVKGLLKLFNKGGSFHNVVNLSWIYVIEDFRRWNRIHFKWKVAPGERQVRWHWHGCQGDSAEWLSNQSSQGVLQPRCLSQTSNEGNGHHFVALLTTRYIYINQRLHKDIYVYIYTLTVQIHYKSHI